MTDLREIYMTAFWTSNSAQAPQETGTNRGEKGLGLQKIRRWLNSARKVSVEKFLLKRFGVMRSAFLTLAYFRLCITEPSLWFNHWRAPPAFPFPNRKRSPQRMKILAKRYYLYRNSHPEVLKRNLRQLPLNSPELLAQLSAGILSRSFCNLQTQI